MSSFHNRDLKIHQKMTRSDKYQCHKQLRLTIPPDNFIFNVFHAPYPFPTPTVCGITCKMLSQAKAIFPSPIPPALNHFPGIAHVFMVHMDSRTTRQFSARRRMEGEYFGGISVCVSLSCNVSVVF